MILLPFLDCRKRTCCESKQHKKASRYFHFYQTKITTTQTHISKMKSIQVFLLACLFSAACATFREHTRQAPKLTFFCEVDPVTIPSISTPAVLSALRAMNATVR
jgi:hypothetical protein